MLKNLNTTLRTVALVLVVLLAAWWTWYLRGSLTEERRELEARDDRIEELDLMLGEERASRQQLDQELVEERGRSAELQAAIEDRDRQIVHLFEEVAERDARIEQQEAALRLLKVDHRIARAEVLAQRAPDETGGGWETDVRFTEHALDGVQLGEAVEFTLQGRYLYLESLVVKFTDDHVEAGDFLRGTSIALFRRAFGEDQSPEQGVLLDRAGQLPGAYGGDAQPDEFYESLWARFWDYANDPDAAAVKGVRAIHGEAPFMELRPGRIYRIELRSSGGLSIRAE